MYWCLGLICIGDITMYIHSLCKILTTLILVSTLCACDKPTPTQVRPVRAEQVLLSNIAAHYSYAGVVRAHHDIVLSFQVGGKITRRYVDIGDNIKPGELLAEIDSKDLVLDVQNIEAQLKSEQSSLLLVKDDLQRYSPLVKAGHITQSFYDQAKTKYDTSVASVDKMQSSLDLAKNKLIYAKLYADYPGVITKVQASAGQIISPGQAVMEMAGTNEKEIVISVPEQRINEWQSINKINVTLWAYPKMHYAAKLREISGEADPATRTYTVKLSVIDADATMRLGMTANVQVDVLRPKPMIVVPLTSIYYESRNPIIWVINPKDMTVQPVKVTLGAYENNKIIVDTGLKSGMWIVTAGVNSLRAGQKVKLVEEE
jgi:multidrug efflux system membrane fusion protein